MKAIILAAGMGSRIHDLTGGNPKSFLEVQGKSIIAHQISCLKEAGVQDIVIITGYRREAFKKFAGNDVTLLYNPFYKTTGVLGSFWFAKEYLDGPFLFMHADTYFEKEILQRVLAIPGNTFAIEFKPCGEEEMKVVVREGLIQAISKEISKPDGEFIGLAKIEDFVGIKEMVEMAIEDHSGAFFEKIIQELILKGIPFKAVNINGFIWEEVDFKDDYLNLLKVLERQSQ